MPLKVTNEVSLMDVVAIGGLLLGGAGMIFGYGADIQTNATDIAHIKGNLEQVERRSEEKDKEILEQLKEQRLDLKEIRDEGAEGRKDISEKLDKLIERELNGN